MIKEIRAKEEDKLICRFCKLNESTMVLSCGHLTVCRDCCLREEANLFCYICYKRSIDT